MASLPSAPIRRLGDNLVLQPPLSRRGSGPGLVLVLPASITKTTVSPLPLDPEPVLKWAEEGFAVAAITPSKDIDARQTLNQALDALQALETVDVKDKFAIIVYDAANAPVLSAAANEDSRVAAIVCYGLMSGAPLNKPTLLHLTSDAPRPENPSAAQITQHIYTVSSPLFVHPHDVNYSPPNATSAHTRTLVFLKKILGGPYFDIEAVWDEHTFSEFADRSVEKTMATMVAEPFVNHIPTMTGGIGREQMTAFYRDHFIFANPDDSRIEMISRTVGPDRVVDEFIFHLTHDRVVDALLPGVPPTGKKLAIPTVAVITIRGDRLVSEHLWWDQATALRQAGLLPTYLPMPGYPDNQHLRLPVSGVEAANMLIDESKGRSNEMFGPEWGIQTKETA